MPRCLKKHHSISGLTLLLGKHKQGVGKEEICSFLFPSRQVYFLLEWNLPLGASLLPCSSPTGGVRLGHKKWNISGALCTWCNVPSHQPTPSPSLIQGGAVFSWSQPEEPEESQEDTSQHLGLYTLLWHSLNFSLPWLEKVPANTATLSWFCVWSLHFPKTSTSPSASQIPASQQLNTCSSSLSYLWWIQTPPGS